MCIFTQLDHQNASQGHPYDRKRSSGDSNSGVYPAIVRGLQVSTLSGQLLVNLIVANPAYLQILHSPQVAITRGAGGRGEASGIRRARPKAGRRASSIAGAVSVRSRDLLKRNPPPSRLPLTPAPLQLSSSTAVSGTHSKNEPKIEGSRDAKRIPMRSQNRRGIAKMSLERTPGSLSGRVR